MGPFFADSKTNNAHILNNVSKTNAQGIVAWLNEDDIFI